MLSLRGSTTTVLWLILLLCCIVAPIAVMLGIVLRRSFLWWCASTLTLLALAIAVSLAALNKLGFK